MNKVQINRAVARLAGTANEKARDSEGNLSKEFVSEFKRIYNADPKMELMNAYSVRMMFRLNLRYRIEQLHMFGIFIELPGDQPQKA